MTDRIAEITARCEAAVIENDYCEPVYGSSTYTLIMHDIPYLLSQLVKRDREIERIKTAIADKGGTEHYPTEDAYLSACKALDKAHRELERLQGSIASVHKSLDFADSQRQSCKNYTELAINNGLALGQIAVTLKHDFKQPLPAPSEEGAKK